MRMDLLMEWSRPTRLLALVCKRMTFDMGLPASAYGIHHSHCFQGRGIARVALARSMAALAVGFAGFLQFGTSNLLGENAKCDYEQAARDGTTQPRAGWRMKIQDKE